MAVLGRRFVVYHLQLVLSKGSSWQTEEFFPPRTRDTSLGRREEWTGVSVHWCSSPEMKKALALQLTPCQYGSMSSGSRKADWVADGAVGFSVRDLKRWRTQHCPSVTWVCGDKKFTNSGFWMLVFFLDVYLIACFFRLLHGYLGFLHVHTHASTLTKAWKRE